MDSQVLTTLMSCPRLHDFKFNLNLVAISGKSVSMEMGSIVHTGLEWYYKGLIQGLTKPMAIGGALVKADEYSKNPEEVRNCTIEDKALALKTLEQYFEFWKNDSWSAIEAETVKGDVLYQDDTIRILWKAKFDLIINTNSNLGIVPEDHKTMKQRRETLLLNNQFKGQCILLGSRTIFVNKVGFQTSLKPNEKFTRAPISYSGDQLLEWQGEILPRYAYMLLQYAEEGYWPPNFTHCESKYGRCSMYEVCAVNKNMREDELKRLFTVGKPWDIQNED